MRDSEDSEASTPAGPAGNAPVRPSVAVILPCHNEEIAIGEIATLGATLAARTAGDAIAQLCPSQSQIAGDWQQILRDACEKAIRDLSVNFGESRVFFGPTRTPFLRRRTCPER